MTQLPIFCTDRFYIEIPKMRKRACESKTTKTLTWSLIQLEVLAAILVDFIEDLTFVLIGWINGLYTVGCSLFSC